MTGEIPPERTALSDELYYDLVEEFRNDFGDDFVPPEVIDMTPSELSDKIADFQQLYEFTRETSSQSDALAFWRQQRFMKRYKNKLEEQSVT